MKLIASLVLLALMAQAPAGSVAGKWTLPLETPHGKMVMTLDLKLDGKKVTGSMSSEQGGTMTVTGEFAEGRLKVVAPIDNGELVFVAKLKDADTLSGVLSSPMGDLAGTATRVKK